MNEGFKVVDKVRVNGGLWRYASMKGELQIVKDELPYNHGGR